MNVNINSVLITDLGFGVEKARTGMSISNAWHCQISFEDRNLLKSVSIICCCQENIIAAMVISFAAIENDQIIHKCHAGKPRT
jgi:hypothetical protein